MTPFELDQLATARRLGYGDDVEAMNIAPEGPHRALAEWLGFPASYALRQAAGEDVDSNLALLEEATVMALQALCRRAGRMPWERGE